VLIMQDPPNQPPVAFISASPITVLVGKTSAPLSVDLDAGTSYDPEGGELEFAFDRNGDGSFDPFDIASFNSFTFTNPGVYYPGVRVKDDAGNITQANAMVNVYRISPTVRETGLTLISPTAITALQSSNSRHIGIAYYDSVSDDLRFMVSADQTGDSWLQSYVVDSLGAEWISFQQGQSQFNMAYTATATSFQGQPERRFKLQCKRYRRQHGRRRGRLLFLRQYHRQAGGRVLQLD
jgi:hypothetical protein